MGIFRFLEKCLKGDPELNTSFSNCICLFNIFFFKSLKIKPTKTKI